MATSLDQIATYLERRELKFQREDAKDMIVVPFRLDEIGAVMVVVRLEESGEFFKVFIPKLFTYQSGPHKAALLQTLLLTSWETKMLQWEYDPSDGEVRAMVEFPLEDAPLTERQFFRAFDGLLHLSVRFHPRLKQVIESGEDPGRAEPGAGADSEWGAFLRGGGGDDGGGAPDAL